MQNFVLEKKLDVSKGLKQAIVNGHTTTKEVAESMEYSPSLISKFIKGHAKLDFNQAEDLIDSLPSSHDKNLLVLYIASQMTGGLTPPPLDGKRINHLSAALSSRAFVEFKQATDALTNALDEFSDDPQSVVDKSDVIECIGQAWDVYGLIPNLCIEVADQYGFQLEDIVSKREKVWHQEQLIS